MTDAFAAAAGIGGAPPWIMGVLNATPDSFSDGGRYPDPVAAIAAGRAMAQAGADIIDVGGESARPGAMPVPPDIEQARILPIIRALAGEGFCVSVDTRHAATMAAALDAGARIVNDISGLTHDPASPAVLAQRHCAVILMHMRGTPATMAGVRGYTDVVADVATELFSRVDAAVAAGIRPERIAIDPGIGFAKGLAENLALLRDLPALRVKNCPLVVGVSRKAFIGRLSGVAAPSERVAGSLAAGLFAVLRGADMLRVHDVAVTAQALRVWRALVSLDTHATVSPSLA